ncbi:MAG: peptide ABC transporter substrate-binding protein [Chloroflexi bacterium]|nr:peptide ABC transporter substrate-binding protein [Chloroflexota bacterium]
MRTLRLPLILLVAGVAAIVFIVYQFVIPRNTVLVPAPGGTYTEGVVGAPQAINPLLCQPTSVDNDLCRLVFRGLTRLSPNGEIVPDLADVVANNASTFTARIRGDARWEDGAAVGADDVLFTIALLQDQNFPGDPNLRRLWQSVRVSKLDETTVRFELAQPSARFLDFTSIGLLPQHVLSGTNATDLARIPFNLQPKGNGPWRVVEVATSSGRISAVTLEPSGSFAGPKPQLARVVFRYFSTAQPMIDAFRSRDIDGMSGVPDVEMQRLRTQDDTAIYSMPQARYVAFFFNLRKDSGAAFLSDTAVRQALMLALDRDALIRNALSGRAVLANTPFIADSWAWSSNVRTYSRDMARARELLTDAGYELRAASTSSQEVWQKNGEPLGFTLTVPDNDAARAVADLAAQQWRELGIPVAVQPVRNLQRGSLQPRQFQVALVEILMDGDPDPFSLWHGSQALSGKNYTGWDNADANKLLADAHTSVDRAARTTAYAQFQEIFSADLPALVLYYPTYQYVLSTRVRNVEVAPMIYAADRLRTLGQWTVNTRRVLAEERQ